MYDKLTVTTLLVVLYISCVGCRELEHRSQGYTDRNEDQDYSNEIEDSSFKLEEPYNSVLQTTARLALAQSRIAKVLNIETLMKLVNRVGKVLAKKANLAKAIKGVTILLASLITSNIFFPSTFVFVDRLWQDPVHTLNLDGYLSNGASERSVLEVVSSRADKAIQRMGLGDSVCRERSLCYTGELLKCVFPTSSEMVSRFITENFVEGAYKDNKYFRAFSSGLMDQNCTRSMADSLEPRSCLGRFFTSIFATDQEEPSTKSVTLAQDPAPRNSRQILHAVRY